MRFLIFLIPLLMLCASKDSMVLKSAEPLENRYSKMELSRDNMEGGSGVRANRDYLKQQLQDGFLSRCNIPKEMRQGKSYRIELRVNEKNNEDLILNLGDKPLVSNIKICENMVADLNGSGFKIVSKDSTRQTRNPFGVTTWRWDITPLKYGNAEIEINLYCLVVDEYGNRDVPPVKINTYTEKINIKVNVKSLLLDLLKKYWLKIVSTIGSFGFIGYIIKIVKKRIEKKKKQKIRDFLNSK